MFNKVCQTCGKDFIAKESNYLNCLVCRMKTDRWKNIKKIIDKTENEFGEDIVSIIRDFSQYDDYMGRKFGSYVISQIIDVPKHIIDAIAIENNIHFADQNDRKIPFCPTPIEDLIWTRTGMRYSMWIKTVRSHSIENIGDSLGLPYSTEKERRYISSILYGRKSCGMKRLFINYGTQYKNRIKKAYNSFSWNGTGSTLAQELELV